MQIEKHISAFAVYCSSTSGNCNVYMWVRTPSLNWTPLKDYVREKMDRLRVEWSGTLEAPIEGFGTWFQSFLNEGIRISFCEF